MYSQLGQTDMLALDAVRRVPRRVKPPPFRLGRGWLLAALLALAALIVVAVGTLMAPAEVPPAPSSSPTVVSPTTVPSR